MNNKLTYSDDNYSYNGYNNYDDTSCKCDHLSSAEISDDLKLTVNFTSTLLFRKLLLLMSRMLSSMRMFMQNRKARHWIVFGTNIHHMTL